MASLDEGERDRRKKTIDTYVDFKKILLSPLSEYRVDGVAVERQPERNVLLSATCLHRCVSNCPPYRYAEEGKEVHPYKPWCADDGDKKAQQHYRSFKACQNSVEWTVYMVPLTLLHAIYTPAIPVVGKYAPWAGTLLALMYAAGNAQYVSCSEPRYSWRMRFARLLYAPSR